MITLTWVAKHRLKIDGLKYVWKKKCLQHHYECEIL